MNITRRSFLITASTAGAAAGLLSRLPAWARQTEGSFTPLRGDVGIFDAPRSGGTIGWYLGDDAVVVVDSKGPQFAQACIDGIRSRTERAIDVLINTHHHGDHTGGNPVFRDVVGKIVAHANVPKLQRKAAEQRDNVDSQEYPDTTFEKQWSMDLGGETVTLTHLGPAHTGGDCIVHFAEADVVHMGDLIFNRWCPFIDRDGGASVQGWIGTLEKAIETYDGDTVFIFGHGKSSTGSAEDLAHLRGYLEWVWEITANGIQAGRTPEQIAEPGLSKPFSDFQELNERLGLIGNVRVAYAEQGGGKS